MKLKSFLLSACVAAALATTDAVEAQVANISTTAASSFNSFNQTTSMQNAAGLTTFSNDGQTMLTIRGGATAVTATIQTQAKSMSQAGYGSVSLTDLIVSVPSGSLILTGPFPQGRWNTPQGTVSVSFTAVTGVSVSAVSVAQ